MTITILHNHIHCPRCGDVFTEEQFNWKKCSGGCGVQKFQGTDDYYYILYLGDYMIAWNQEDDVWITRIWKLYRVVYDGSFLPFTIDQDMIKMILTFL